MSIDRKFTITATSIASGNVYTQNEAVCFLAKDRAFLKALPAYLQACKDVGAGDDQIKAVELMIERVREYQQNNPAKVKVPDVDPNTEAGCLKP